MNQLPFSRECAPICHQFQQNLAKYTASVSCYASPRSSEAQAAVCLTMFWQNDEHTNHTDGQ